MPVCLSKSVTTLKVAAGRASAGSRVKASAAPRVKAASASASSLRSAKGRLAPFARDADALLQTVCAAAVAEGGQAASTNPVDKSKRYVVITGCSSGLGLRAAATMAKSGTHHVVMACRDFSKAERCAQDFGFPAGSYTVMHLDLSSLTSVRQFAAQYKASGYPIDALVCNAAQNLSHDPMNRPETVPRPTGPPRTRPTTQ